MIGSGCCHVFLLDKTTQTLSSVVPGSDFHAPALTVKLGEGIAGAVCETGEVINLGASAAQVRLRHSASLRVV